MKIINIIPLSRGIFKETLSYFSSKDAPVGSIVSVPVRKKEIDALVVSVEEASSAKSKLRAYDFIIKKISSVKTKLFFLPDFIEATRDTARYFATTSGAIIQSLSPKCILTELTILKKNTPNTIKESRNIGTANETFVLQGDHKERITTYKSLIREEFTKSSSVFFCLPSISDIEIAVSELERGIKEYVFVLHSGLTKKQIIQTWKDAVAEPHPILIIATYSFLSIPRKDIGVIILDRENSQSYKTFIRPYFDIRMFAEAFAKRGSMKLIFGDVFLRPETIWRTSQGEFIELNPLKFRSISTASQNIIDMREYRKSGFKKDFSLLSNELKELIEKNKVTNENLFILIGRKGIASLTLCNDCGEIVKCLTCNVPTTLHKNSVSDKNNIFVCHRCGMKEDAGRKCDGCNGWRLTALGIGIERIEEEIKNIFPEVKLFKIDSDSVKTRKKGIDIAENFFIAPGSVLLGTQIALSYINKDIDSVAIVGMDSLFSVPDFRINEKIFNTLLSLRAKALKNFLIQTRNPDAEIFTTIVKGNLFEFYNSEIKSRKQFMYPPFKILIKITYKGKKIVVSKEISKLMEILEKYKPVSYSAFSPSGGVRFAMNILIRLNKNSWINNELLDILRSLPPTFVVQVDPIDLL